MMMLTFVLLALAVVVTGGVFAWMLLTYEVEDPEERHWRETGDRHTEALLKSMAQRRREVEPEAARKVFKQFIDDGD